MPRDVLVMLIGASLPVFWKYGKRIVIWHRVSRLDCIGVYGGSDHKKYPYGYKRAYKELQRRGWPSWKEFIGRR